MAYHDTRRERLLLKLLVFFAMMFVLLDAVIMMTLAESYDGMSLWSLLLCLLGTMTVWPLRIRIRRNVILAIIAESLIVGAAFAPRNSVYPKAVASVAGAAILLAVSKPISMCLMMSELEEPLKTD
jgi:hypothetical protein